MKKIAILTQPLGTNYGGIIQNFALTEVLKRENYRVETINRITKNPHSTIKIFLNFIKLNIQKNLFNKKVFVFKHQQEIFEKLLNFLSTHINLSKKLDTTAHLNNYFIKHSFDAIIVGSDQTWRPAYSPNIYNYFLDFLENDHSITKLAYATSFGTSDWEFTDEETKRCAQLVQQFDAVSVREESAVEMTQKYLNKESVWVLDPTMLLDKTDYKKLIDGRRQPKRSGIYSYILDETEEISAFIESAQQVLEMDHFTNQPALRNKKKTSKNLADYRYPTLEGWLQGFEEADFIITNSFHGTVFSIIFNKPFITIINIERGASRFHSLLSLFNLENRLMTNQDQLKEIIKQPINFASVNEKMEILRKDSLEFLLTNLK